MTRCWVKVNGEYVPMTDEHKRQVRTEILRRMYEAVRDYEKTEENKKAAPGWQSGHGTKGEQRDEYFAKSS